MFLSFLCVWCARRSLACYVCRYGSHGRGREGGAHSAGGVVGLEERERETEREGKVYQGRKSMPVQIREAQQNDVFVRQNGSKMWPVVVLFHHKHFFKRSSDLWLEITVDSTICVSERPQTTRHGEIKVRRAIRSPMDESGDVKMDLKSWSLLFSAALAFFCSSSCEGSNNRLYLVCSVWPIFPYSLFSQMLSEHHLVGEAEIWGVGGGATEKAIWWTGKGRWCCSKGEEPPPPHPTPTSPVIRGHGNDGDLFSYKCVWLSPGW